MEEKTVKLTEEQIQAFEEYQSMRHDFWAYREQVQKQNQKRERAKQLHEDFELLEPMINRKLQEKAGFAAAVVAVGLGILMMFKTTYDVGKLSK